jgi:nucleoside-triphosphatase THEP1
MSIYILSRPIHSGKTTELLQWSNRQKNILGILMPDINGSRKFLTLDKKEIFDAECVDITNTKLSITTIGKFNFYSEAFEKANLILLNALSKNPNWLVIDEVGKLELDSKGFYKSVMEAAKIYADKNKTGNLLVTVRDSILKEVIADFNIKNYTIINSLEAIK